MDTAPGTGWRLQQSIREDEGPSNCFVKVTGAPSEGELQEECTEMGRG